MSILGNLLNYTSDPPKIKDPTNKPATISDDQFKNYARRSVVEKFMSIKSDIRRNHELTNDFKK